MDNHYFSHGAVTLITTLVMAAAIATLALDWYSGFAYDHWRDTLMARF